MDLWIENVRTERGCWSRRSEVSDEAVDICSELLVLALAGERPELPEVSPRCCLAVSAEGGLLSAKVTVPGVNDDLIQIEVVASEEAVRDATLQPTVDVPAPWCAAVLCKGIRWWAEARAWLCDFKHCLAWAWVELQAGDR